jgi:NAD(P)H dehydrogenase (quinone)
MKNILIIIANPNSKSLTHAMANIIKEEKEKQSLNVKILDLYNDHKQDFLTFDNPNQIPQDLNTAYHQELISWADEMIFIFPYWWGSEPAILHNWVDSNLLSGFAFEFKDERPNGLLTGKRVHIYTTSGTPKFVYTITGGYRWLKKRWQKGIVEFCGMKLDGFHTYGGIDASSTKIESILSNVRKSASK